MVIPMFTNINPTANTNNSRQAHSINSTPGFQWDLGIAITWESICYYILFYNVYQLTSIDLPLLPQCNGRTNHSNVPLLFLSSPARMLIVLIIVLSFIYCNIMNGWLSHHQRLPLLFSSPPARILMILMIVPRNWATPVRTLHCNNTSAISTPSHVSSSTSQPVPCPHIHVAIPALCMRRV